MAKYATVAELKQRIQITRTLTTAQQEMLEALLEGVGECIERMCKRESFVVEDEDAYTKHFASSGGTHIRIPPCIEVEEVEVDDEVLTSPSSSLARDGDWIPCTGDPSQPDYNSLPYTLIVLDWKGSYTSFPDPTVSRPPVVKVTAVWGESAEVPPDIREAVLMQAARWYKELQGAMDGALATDELGRIVYRKGLSSSVQQILVDGGWVLPLYGGR